MKVMNSIYIKDRFRDRIFREKKTTTIIDGVRFVSNLVKNLDFCTLYPLPISIEKLEYVKFRDLTRAQAKKDGFNSLRALKRCLLDFYPHLTNNSDLTIIHFRVL